MILSIFSHWITTNVTINNCVYHLGWHMSMPRLFNWIRPVTCCQMCRREHTYYIRWIDSKTRANIIFFFLSCLLLLLMCVIVCICLHSIQQFLAWFVLISIWNPIVSVSISRDFPLLIFNYFNTFLIFW